MASMKSILLPLLEEISDGADTRLALHERCKDVIPDWHQFKRIFSGLIADGLIARKGTVFNTFGWDIVVFGLTEDGMSVVQSFGGDV